MINMANSCKGELQGQVTQVDVRTSRGGTAAHPAVCLRFADIRTCNCALVIWFKCEDTEVVVCAAIWALCVRVWMISVINRGSWW